MNGKENLFFEITNNNLEGKYILLSLRGFLQHLEKVEAKIFFTFRTFLVKTILIKFSTYSNFLKDS